MSQVPAEEVAPGGPHWRLARPRPVDPRAYDGVRLREATFRFPADVDAGATLVFERISGGVPTGDSIPVAVTADRLLAVFVRALLSFAELEAGHAGLLGEGDTGALVGPAAPVVPTVAEPALTGGRLG